LSFKPKRVVIDRKHDGWSNNANQFYLLLAALNGDVATHARVRRNAKHYATIGANYCYCCCCCCSAAAAADRTSDETSDQCSGSSAEVCNQKFISGQAIIYNIVAGSVRGEQGVPSPSLPKIQLGVWGSL